MIANDNTPFNEREFLTMAMLSSVELTRLWMVSLGDRANSAQQMMVAGASLELTMTLCPVPRVVMHLRDTDGSRIELKRQEIVEVTR